MGSEPNIKDPNPILDEGNPTSTAGLPAIVELCNILRRNVSLDPPHASYIRGWGPNGADEARVIASWSITVQDMNNQPTVLRFDVTDDESPITIGMDMKKFSITVNLSSPTTIKLRRSFDQCPRILKTYMSGKCALTARLRLLLAPVTPVTIGLLGKTPPLQPLRAVTLAKRIHNATHASAAQTLQLCRDAGWNDKELQNAITNTCEMCEVCAKTGPPAHSKKLSLTHVNQNFNDEIQADFLFAKIRNETFTVIHYVDTGTAFSEGTVVTDRKASTVITQFDALWLYKHGAPNALSGDDEFNRRPITKALSERGVVFRGRPSRRHNKVGIVERKNGTIKRILERLQMDEKSEDNARTIVKKAIFLSNVFSGSSIMSAFELTRGYTPSILGKGSQAVTEEMLKAHKQQEAVRAIHRLLRSRNPKVINCTAIKEGDKVLYYYNSTKGNEDKEWRTGVVKAVHEHYAELKTEKKDRRLKQHLKISVLPQHQILLTHLWTTRWMKSSMRGRGETHRN